MRTRALSRIATSFGKPLAIAAANVLLLEVLLGVVDRFTPLERPPELGDRFQNQWLEGFDWFDGETRLYKYKPNSQGSTYGHPFRVNRWGFRGDDFLPRDDPRARGGFRILALGDSITVGIGVAEEDRYTDVLEKELRQRCPNRGIEVINLGVQGFETLQEAKMLRRMWPAIRPDLTIVGFWPNDPNLHYSFFLPYSIPAPRALRDGLEGLLLFRLLESPYDRLYRAWKGLPTHEQEVRRAYDPSSRDWKLFLASVQSIADWVRTQTGRPPGVVFLGDVATAKAEGQYSSVRKAFERSGFFWAEASRPYRRVSRFENHPDAETHRGFAEALLQVIERRDLLSCHNPPHR